MSEDNPKQGGAPRGGGDDGRGTDGKRDDALQNENDNGNGGRGSIGKEKNRGTGKIRRKRGDHMDDDDDDLEDFDIETGKNNNKNDIIPKVPYTFGRIELGDEKVNCIYFKGKQYCSFDELKNGLIGGDFGAGSEAKNVFFGIKGWFGLY